VQPRDTRALSFSTKKALGLPRRVSRIQSLLLFMVNPTMYLYTPIVVKRGGKQVGRRRVVRQGGREVGRQRGREAERQAAVYW